MLVLLGALAGYARLQARLAARSEELVESVREAHGLMLGAAASADYDLFEALQFNPRSPAATLHLSLLERDLILNRPTLGLMAVGDEAVAGAADADIVLAADLERATVTQRVPYSSRVADGPAEMVWLERRFDYRLKGDSWALAEAPDDSDSSAPVITAPYGRLTLIYPDQDAEFGQAAGPRLEALVEALCAARRLTCPANMRLQLRLSADPNAMLRLNDDYRTILMQGSFTAFIGQLYQLTLPAPSLVGRPIDPAGEEVLYRGYAGWVAAAILREIGGRTDQEIAIWLAELGVRPPDRPVTPLPRPARAAVPPPIPLPAQDLYLLCGGEYPQAFLRYSPRQNRWADETAGLMAALPDIGGPPSYVRAMGLPDDSGVIINEMRFEPPLAPRAIYLWRDGEGRVLLESEGYVEVVPAGMQRAFDPEGRSLYLFGFQGPVDTMRWIRLDLATCLAGTCLPQESAGPIVWSPGGRYGLMWQLPIEDSGSVTLIDAAGSELARLDNGQYPVWLDGDRFAFSHIVEVPGDGDPPQYESSLLTGSAAEAAASANWQPAVLFDAAELAQVAGAGADGRPVVIEWLLAGRAAPERWYLGARTYDSPGRNTLSVLALDLATKRLWRLAVMEWEGFFQLFEYPQVLGNGRYLGVVSTDPVSSAFGMSLHLVPLEGEIDAEVGIAASYPLVGDGGYDVSADGEWLAIRGPGGLTLVALGHDYELSMPFEIEGCGGPMWLHPRAESE